MNCSSLTHGIYKITEFDVLDSTNNYLVSLAKDGEPSGRVVIAKRQTAGKGSKGRSFYSPETSGLYMSVLIRKDFSPKTAMLITPMVACAVADALEAVSDKIMGIKWVNDIYCDGKKLCGILTESRFDFTSNRLDYAVIGIGINLTEPKSGFPKEISDIAAALYKGEITEEQRQNVISSVLDRLEYYLSELTDCEQSNSVPPKFLSDYRHRSVLIGKTVYITGANGINEAATATANATPAVKATAVDIDDEARLVVVLDGKRITLDSADVSVKAAD